MLKKLSIIAAVAATLAAATSASAYHETWNGWFNSGYLTYMNNTFDYTSGEGELEDMTDGDDDEFFVSATDVSTFTCQSGQFQGYYIMLYPDASGSKPTGRSGHKEAEGDPSPTWTATGFLHIPSSPPETIEFTASGTWDTGTPRDGYYFNYPNPPATPTYSAYWHLGDSDLEGLTEGEGGSEGELIDYDD
jgi:opacity protein-like surface antigen